jgi:hypothetical protein
MRILGGDVGACWAGTTPLFLRVRAQKGFWGRSSPRSRFEGIEAAYVHELMQAHVQIEGKHQADGEARQVPLVRPFFSIRDLAERWRCSRASVYNQIRGEMVVDFATSGKKGHKLVPLDVVLKIERARMRVLR